MKKTLILLTITAFITILLTACSKQNWYHGAQSAQTAHCMKQANSEFNDCNQPSKESYQSYEKKREQLIQENSSE